MRYKWTQGLFEIGSREHWPKITGIFWGSAAKATETPEAALFGVCSRSIEQCIEDASVARLWRKSATTSIAKMGTVDTAKLTGIFGELM